MFSYGVSLPIVACNSSWMIQNADKKINPCRTCGGGVYNSYSYHLLVIVLVNLSSERAVFAH